MHRPTLLVAESEPEHALSVRKLVLETGKFVLTAHSTEEATELFQLFPNISALVVADDSIIDCEKLLHAVKSSRPELPAVYLSSRIGAKCTPADYNLSSHEPLLTTIRSLLGDPRQIKP